MTSLTTKIRAANIWCKLCVALALVAGGIFVFRAARISRIQGNWNREVERWGKLTVGSASQAEDSFDVSCSPPFALLAAAIKSADSHRLLKIDSAVSNNRTMAGELTGEIERILHDVAPVLDPLLSSTDLDRSDVNNHVISPADERRVARFLRIAGFYYVNDAGDLDRGLSVCRMLEIMVRERFGQEDLYSLSKAFSVQVYQLEVATEILGNPKVDNERIGEVVKIIRRSQVDWNAVLKAIHRRLRTLGQAWIGEIQRGVAGDHAVVPELESPSGLFLSREALRVQYATKALAYLRDVGSLVSGEGGADTISQLKAAEVSWREVLGSLTIEKDVDELLPILISSIVGAATDYQDLPKLVVAAAYAQRFRIENRELPATIEHLQVYVREQGDALSGDSQFEIKAARGHWWLYSNRSSDLGDGWIRSMDLSSPLLWVMQRHGLRFKVMPW